jgi:2'-5' RNA ligase
MSLEGGAHDAPVMRAFCACNLDVASIRRLAEVADSLRGEPLAPRARWVPPTKMHVTLKFFGDIDLGLAPALRDVIAPLATRPHPIHVGFDSLSAFPSLQDAKVIVVLLRDETGELSHLARQVEDSVAKLGFEREARPFRPHVTLARPTAATNATAWLETAKLPPEAARVTELVLYRSDGGAPQQEYAALARFGV